MKIKKQVKELLIVLAVTILLSAGISDFLYSNPHIKFIMSEFLMSAEDKVEVKEISCSTSEILLDDLLKKSNTECNQSLMLINKDFMIKDDFRADVLFYKSTEVQMNSCLISPYEKLSAEIEEKFGEKLYISSAFRTETEQLELEKNNENATVKDASEHQAGLALDVYVKYYSGKGFIKSEAGRYVNKNCWQNGFIIRYPFYGKKETGIKYEPWHLRYVGLPHSEIIYKNRLTLEEYIESLEYGKFYEFNGCIITRQKGDKFEIPETYNTVTVSPDNQDGYILTFAY